MNRKLLMLIAGFSLAATALAAPRQTRAALGEPFDAAASGSESRPAMRSAATVSGNYTVYERRSDAVTVREYVSPSGVVFAVAWNGPIPPDFSALLGSYADEYRTAQGQIPRQPGRKHVQVKTDRLVVERWGHMRNQQGRAYVPDLFPQGVSIDEIL